AAVEALQAAAVAGVLVAAALAALLAVLAAAAGIPSRVGHDVEDLHGRRRIVAPDDQFAGARALLRGLVAGQHAKARTGVQRRREGVVDQLPVLVPALEADACHVELAVADVADRDGALTQAVSLHAADAG